jgi:serine/threonine-protein phosphatase CPPED1
MSISSLFLFYLSHDMKTNLQLWVVIVLIFLLSGCSSRPVTFIQVADPQMGMFSGNNNMEYEKEHLKTAIKAINSYHPDFVIVSGDLTNITADSLQVVTFRQLISEISRSIPVYLVSGNHDVGNIPDDSGISMYRCLYGKDYYRFRKGSIYGIVLNSSLMRNDSLAGQEAGMQDRWLEEILIRASRSGKRVVIFMHHPLFLDKPVEPTGYENFPVPERTRYLELFKKYHVKAIFTGHLHRNRIIDLEGVQQITTAALTTNFGRDSSGFRKVTVSKKQLFQRFIRLDSISNQNNPLK